MNKNEAQAAADTLLSMLDELGVERTSKICQDMLDGIADDKV